MTEDEKCTLIAARTGAPIEKVRQSRKALREALDAPSACTHCKSVLDDSCRKDTELPCEEEDCEDWRVEDHCIACHPFI